MNGNVKMFETEPHGSSIFCVPPLPKTVTNSLEDHSKSFELGHALESYYPILESVFKYLDVTDLQSAKLVNPIWCQLAERELQKRIAPTWISFCYDPSLCLRTSPGFRYNSVALCIIAYNPATIKLEKYVCLHDSPEFNRMTFAEYLGKEVVPAGVEYCTIACSRVPRNITENKCQNSVYQCVFIPNIPKIKVTMFHCNPKNANRISEFVKPNERVKCVLMFALKFRVRAVEAFITELLRGQKPNSVALGGGLVRSTKTFVKDSTQKLFLSDDLFCITFLQENELDSDFNAYSAVINSDSISEHIEAFQEEVMKLKEACVLRSCGMIFRFCCCAKCSKDNETEIISRHFPKYPILGLEVDGEIGWNTSDATNTEQDANEKPKESKTKKQKTVLPQILHGWSTVLVLVTWGKKI